MAIDRRDASPFFRKSTLRDLIIDGIDTAWEDFLDGIASDRKR
jgi:hypothetical protein